MDSTVKTLNNKHFKYGRHMLLAFLFFSYSYTYSMLTSYFNVLVSKFFDEKKSIFHSSLILISYAASLIIFGIIFSIFHIQKLHLSRIIGSITLISSLMIFFLLKTENKNVFLILVYSLIFLIGMECVYYYSFMYKAFSYLPHTGLIFSACMSFSILLQFYLQTYLKNENLVLYSLIVITFICAFLNLSGATGYLSDNDHDEIINSKESQKPHFLKVFISTIIIIILLEFIGNFLTYHLLSLMYSGKAIVYNTPRLFIIISFFIMGIFADISDMHYIPIITFSGVLIGILNPVLMQEESSIYANSCIYYIVAGIINSFFILMMFKLARGKRFAPLIAVSGRIIDAVFSFIFISSVMSSLPLYYIIGIELTAIIIIMLLFTFSGQFNFGHIRQGSSWHISPDDFAIRYKFTEKETEVFISALSFDGTMSELAKSLFMSRSVLYRNLSNICDKTGCGSFQAVKHLYYELPAVEKVQSASENSSEVVINKTNVKQSDTPDVSISNTPNIEAKSPDENTNQNHSKSSNTYKEKKSSSVKSEAYNNEPAPSTPDTDSVDRISVFAKKFSLSAKETQTLTAFLDNPEKTQKELADMQGTTLRTIQRHLAGIKTKTNVKSLIELSNLFHSL